MDPKIQELQNQIESMKKDIGILMSSRVHNKMSNNTRQNIIDAVINGPSFLKSDGSTNETVYSSMIVQKENILYAVPLLQLDSNKAYVGVISGSGAPTTAGGGGTAIKAPKGTLYLRTDGSSTSTRLYIATDSAGAWTSVTTAT